MRHPMRRLRLLTVLILSVFSLLPSEAQPLSATPLPVADTTTYDVIVVGGGPAGIGAALGAAKTGARTLLLERDSRIGGTTVQAEVCDMGLFYAWRRQIIAGPVWEMVKDAVAAAQGSLPDFSRQEPDKWMESCVHVDPDVYSRVAEETLLKAGVKIVLNTEVATCQRTGFGWRVGTYSG